MTDQTIPDYETISAAVTGETWAVEKVLMCYKDEIDRQATVKKRQPDGTFKLEIDEDLTVCADADQLARVFSNILKNAAAYSYLNTEIRISTEKVRGHVFVIFQNKGNTIPAEKLSSLFDKFYRLDESRASDTGGTGLGLAIAKEIILLHGGTIHASSENDTVTFTVQLPAADSENIYPSSSFSQETNN